MRRVPQARMGEGLPRPLAGPQLGRSAGLVAPELPGRARRRLAGVHRLRSLMGAAQRPAIPPPLRQTRPRGLG